jgi:hypothetical protein
VFWQPAGMGGRSWLGPHVPTRSGSEVGGHQDFGGHQGRRDTHRRGRRDTPCRLSELANSSSSLSVPWTTRAEVVAGSAPVQGRPAAGRSYEVCEFCDAGYAKISPGPWYLRRPARRRRRFSRRHASRRTIRRQVLFLKIFFCRHQVHDLRQVRTPSNLTSLQGAVRITV